jgi:hypothetical protein
VFVLRAFVWPDRPRCLSRPLRYRLRIERRRLRARCRSLRPMRHAMTASGANVAVCISAPASQLDVPTAIVGPAASMSNVRRCDVVLDVGPTTSMGSVKKANLWPPHVAIAESCAWEACWLSLVAAFCTSFVHA